MELRNLRYFVVVAEEGSFRKAAERLNIDQSAVSRRVQDLEQELNVRLLERTGKRFTVSASGRAVAERGRRILSEVAAVSDSARQIARGTAGTLRIGLHPSAARHAVVLESLQAFRVACPAVEVVLTPMTELAQMGAVASGAIDAGHVMSADPIGHEFGSITMAKDIWVAAMRTDHRLAVRDSIRLSELEGESLILFPRELHPALYDRVLSDCVAQGLVPQVTQHVIGGDMQIALVGAGLGIGLSLQSLRSHVPRSIALCRINNLHIPITASLIWRPGSVSPVLYQYLHTVGRLCQTEQCSDPSVVSAPAIHGEQGSRDEGRFPAGEEQH